MTFDLFEKIKAINDRDYAAALVCLITVFVFADQNLLAPNLTQIAEYYKFSDSQKDWKLGGELAFGFFLVGAPAALLVGYFTDTSHRCILFGIVIVIGEIPCMLIYFYGYSFTNLFILRCLTGVSIGGATPLIFSLFGDYYEKFSRIYIATAIQLSMVIGIFGGQLFSGIIGPTYGWRLPFLLVPIPALIITILFVFTAKEPSRGSREECMIISSSLEYNGKINCLKINTLIKTKTVILAFLQGIPGCVPWGVIFIFLNDYLAENKGLGVEGAAGIIFTFGAGGCVGLLFGGWIGQQIYNSDKQYHCIFTGSMAMFGIIPVIYIINAPVSTIGYIILIYFAAFLSGFLCCITGPNVKAILTNVTLPETRGTAFAIFNFTDDVGRGGGPYLVALLIHVCKGRRSAFNIAVCFWVICGTLISFMACTVEKDEEKVQRVMSTILGIDREEEIEEDDHTAQSPLLDNRSN